MAWEKWESFHYDRASQEGIHTPNGPITEEKGGIPAFSPVLVSMLTTLIFPAWERCSTKESLRLREDDEVKCERGRIHEFCNDPLVDLSPHSSDCRFTT